MPALCGSPTGGGRFNEAFLDFRDYCGESVATSDPTTSPTCKRNAGIFKIIRVFYVDPGLATH